MLSSFSYNFISNIENLEIVSILVISNNKSVISQNLKVPFGGKFNFSVPQDLKLKAILITKLKNQVLLCQRFEVLSE